MASNAVGRLGVMLPPSLPTIKETTLSWLGSDLESSLFSTHGDGGGDADGQQKIAAAKVQRYIDFDDQCLSLKSGEDSDFSGIQPLPIGSDDTPPMAVNNFNRVVRMDFGSLLESENRPKPIIQSDSESVDEYLPLPNQKSPEKFEEAPHRFEAAKQTDKGITAADFEKLIGMLDSDAADGNLSDVVNADDGTVLERLQLIRLWQLMQEEELKRRQETELALLQAQKLQMQARQVECENLGLERVDAEELGSDGIQDDLDEIESGDLLSNLDEHLEDPDSEKNDAEVEALSQATSDDKKEDFDELPIDHNGKKSFEQLLEEELQKERQMVKQKEDKPKGPIKRPFLRKGQGLARFKGPPVRKPPVKPKADNVTNEKLTKKDANKAPTTRTKDAITKAPINTSKVSKSQQPVTNQKPAYKRMKAPIQKLTLKPETSTSDRLPSAKKKSEPHTSRPKNKDMDLEEFEMLERYAEDDASFFSEPSLVVSLLQHEKDEHVSLKDEGNMSLRERVRERRRLREEARKQAHTSIMLGNGGTVDLEASHEHLLKREGQSDAILYDVDDDLETTIRNESIKNDIPLDSERSLGPPSPYFKSSESHKVKVVQRKTASLVRREKLVRPVAQPANGPVFSPIENPLTQLSSNQAFAKLQSSPNSAFSPHHQPIVITGSGSNSETDKEEDVANGINDFEDEQTWGDIEMSVLNNSRPESDAEEEEKSEGSGRKYKCSDYMEPESEDIENPVKDTDEDSKRGSDNRISLSPPPPPTLLMQKLFPGLKIPKKSAVEKTQQEAPPHSRDESEDEHPTAQVEGEEASQASLLKQKLQELEKEISRFKKENATLETMRSRQEQQLQHLSKEMEEFKKQKEEEVARLEEYKKTETRKLKKERRLFEEHVLATKMMPRKEEREEILKLQEEIESLKVENKSKEQRWTSANNRMRGQVERLELENKELTNRVKEMEAQRVKEWNKKRQSVTKAPSMWQAVNEMVESSVFDIENENPDRTHLSTNNSRTGGSASNKSKKAARTGLLKRKDGEKAKPKSCMKPAPKPQVLNSHDENVREVDSPSSDNQSETTHKDGKIERMLKDGGRLVEFPNGTQKEISADGQTVKVKFANGDVKQIYADGSVVYYYEENGTTHTTHPDGLQVLEFPSNQVEHHFPDGTKQITFPDQTVKYLHTDGTEQTVFPDGTEMHVAANKDKTIVFANGQREIHTSSFKRREYPDGTSKTVFEDGRQETRYASGRLRVKDAHGNVIVDRMAGAT